jgi:anti-sigma-K factor RskA
VSPRHSTPEGDRYRDELAAYALGALGEPEAAELRRHLHGCEECREHLRWLQPAVDLLPRAVPQVEPPPRLRKRLMSTVRAESREAVRADARGTGWRDWGAFLLRPATAAVAGVLLVAGVLGGYLLHQPTENRRSVVSVEASESLAPTASGTLERQDGSAILRVEGMPALAGNRVYETWVQRGGTMEPSSLFTLRRNRSGDAAIPGPLEGADAVLVTAEPRGGSSQPTSRPVLRASLD